MPKAIEYFISFFLSITLKYKKCEECGSKKYTEWDYEAKKCPQCKDGIIGESDWGVLIMAD